MMVTLGSISTYGPYIWHIVGLALVVVLAACLVLFVAWTVHTYNVYRKYSHLPGPKVTR